jgi:hypothetical protein
VSDGNDDERSAHAAQPGDAPNPYVVSNPLVGDVDDAHTRAAPSAASEPVPGAVGSKYIPPALNEPDAAARVAASAAAARAAARAVTAARLANTDPNARLSTTPRPAPASAVGGSEVALRSGENAPERENAMPFTSSRTTIDRSNYVINAAGEGQEPSGNAAPATSTYTSAPTPAAASAPAHHAAPSQPRVVYVEAPPAPVKKNNRGFGSLVVLLSAVGFAVLFALVIFALFYITTGRIVTNFLGQASFFVPVVLFVIGFLLLVMIANRAGWWAYVLGSIGVGAFTYAATIGVLLLLTGIISSTPQEASADLARAVVNPLVIAAGVLAREVSLWTGWAIGVRGRRVAARNTELAEAFQRALDDRDHNFAEHNAHDVARADRARADLTRTDPIPS